MKAYVEPSGIHHRTLAEAKTAGRPYEPIDIPTDHKGLLDYINRIAFRTPAPLAALPELADTEDENLPTTIAGRCAFNTSEIITCDVCNGDGPPDGGMCGGCGAGYGAYKNGDPTRPFMGSRDPSAIFTCTTCGANNRNP